MSLTVYMYHEGISGITEDINIEIKEGACIVPSFYRKFRLTN